MSLNCTPLADIVMNNMSLGRTVERGVGLKYELIKPYIVLDLSNFNSDVDSQY
jgi:hypothetical protein